MTEDTFNAKYKVKASDDLRAAVRHERRIELAGEGLRFYDLIRWGTFVSTMQKFGKTDEASIPVPGHSSPIRHTPTRFHKARSTM